MRNQQLLQDQGWRVAIVWECALRRDETGTVDRVAAWLRDPAEGLLELSA